MKKTNHPFHLILDEETIMALLAAGALDKAKTLSRFIADVFVKFYWLVEKHHLTGPNQRCRYRRIPGGGERFSLWLPLPEELYQRLKSIHKDNDFYSVGQIVRMVIYTYLDMRKDCSHDELIKKLDWLQDRWNNLRDCFRKGNKSQKGKNLSILRRRNKAKSHMRNNMNKSKTKMKPYLVLYDHNAIPTMKMIT